MRMEMKSSCKKVCIYCKKWGSGGIESYLVNLLEHMDLSKLDISIVTFSVTSNIFHDRLQTLGVQLYEIGKRQCLLGRDYRRLKAFLVREQYDIIHINAYVATSCMLAFIAYHLGIKRRIIHSHNNELRKSRLRLLKKFVHRFSKNVFAHFGTDFWACSSEAGTFMFPHSINEKRLKIVKNGIDVNRYLFNSESRNAVREQMKVEDKFVMGHIGRISYQKNQDFLLEILESILQVKENAVLLLVGEGDTHKLKEKAKACKLENNLIFREASNNVGELLNAMDIFVFPSRFEAFGIVVLEAQCSGLPTFCSDKISEMLNITSLFHSIKLEKGGEEWANIILDEVNIRPQRCSFATQIVDNGYDIRQTADWVYQQYMALN